MNLRSRTHLTVPGHFDQKCKEIDDNDFIKMIVDPVEIDGLSKHQYMGVDRRGYPRSNATSLCISATLPFAITDPRDQGCNG